jgi:NTE family protein
MASTIQQQPVESGATACAGSDGRTRPRLGLVLSGGGAVAAYFSAGVIQAIEEIGLRPTLLSGVSAGAINVSAVAAGYDGASLAELWTRIGTGDIFRGRRDLWRLINFRNLLRPPTGDLTDFMLNAVGWTWVMDTTPARQLLIEIMGGTEVPVMPGITVLVSAVDQGTGRVVRFTNELPSRYQAKSPRSRREFQCVRPTVDHIMASAAAPLLFPPGRLGGATFVDAGLVANTPLAPALDYEPDAVIVVSSSGITRPAPAPASLGEAIGLFAQNVVDFALMRDFKHAETMNVLASAAPDATDKKPVDLLLVRPSGLAVDPSLFMRFERETAIRLIAQGRAEGRRALADWSALERLQ